MSHFLPPLFCDLHNNIVILAGQSYEYSEKDRMRLLSLFSPEFQKVGLKQTECWELKRKP